MTESSSSEAPPAVSVVIPVCNEAANVAPLVCELVKHLNQSGSFEIIYVNDGSTDHTESELTRLILRAVGGRADRRALCSWIHHCDARR
jgi:dolichol-phosphate mannosyltransferase